MFHFCCFTAVNNVRSWALDREVFQNIMRRTAETRHEQYRNFLRRLAPKCIKRARITRIVRRKDQLGCLLVLDKLILTYLCANNKKNEFFIMFQMHIYI